jgi:hypothetical protein
MIIACNNDFADISSISSSEYRFRYFVKWNVYEIYAQRDEEGNLN